MGKRRIRIQDLGNILSNLIRIAENIFPEPQSGKDKRKWVVDFINEKLDIPFLNEKQEGLIIGILVDVVVSMVFKK